MRKRTANGMTEIIPSVDECREQLLREHGIPLLASLLDRVERLEAMLLVPPEPDPRERLNHLLEELANVQAANTVLDVEGAAHE